MTSIEMLKANRENPERTLQLLEEGLGEDFRILTDFNAEIEKIDWLSQTKVIPEHKYRVAKSYFEASRFAHTRISSRYELDLIHQLDDELCLAKPDYYRTAINIYRHDVIDISEVPYKMELSVLRCFFGVIVERILKKDKKEAKFNKIWKLYQYGHWPVRWNDDGLQIIY
jgi:hypothetical protein